MKREIFVILHGNRRVKRGDTSGGSRTVGYVHKGNPRRTKRSQTLKKSFKTAALGRTHFKRNEFFPLSQSFCDKRGLAIFNFLNFKLLSIFFDFKLRAASFRRANLSIAHLD